MYGAIIGDIVGSTYELHNVKTEDFELFPQGSSFTDDTVLSVAVAIAIFLARKNCDKTEIKKYLEKNFRYKFKTLDEIRDTYVFDSRAGYSIPPAIQAFLESNSYEIAIRKAISIGGDSDTIACIAGAIAHAHYKSIPEEIYNRAMSFLDSGLKKTINEFETKYHITH